MDQLKQFHSQEIEATQSEQKEVIDKIKKDFSIELENLSQELTHHKSK